MKEKEVPFILDNYQYKTLVNAIKAKNDFNNTYERSYITKIINSFDEFKQELNPLLNDNNELAYYYITISILGKDDCEFDTPKEIQTFYYPKKKNIILNCKKGIVYLNMIENYVKYKDNKYKLSENKKGNLYSYIYYSNSYYYDYYDSDDNYAQFIIEVIENSCFFDGYFETNTDFLISKFNGVVEYHTSGINSIIPKGSKIFIDINQFGLIYNLIPKMEYNLSNIDNFPYDFSNYWYIGINIKNKKETSNNFSNLKVKGNINVLIISIDNINNIRK